MIRERAGARSACRPPDRDFADAIRIIRGSHASAILAAAARGWSASVAHSVIAAGVRRLAAEFEQLPQVARLRTIAIVVAVAAATHVVLLRTIPSRSVPAVSRALWLVVAAAALLVAAAASALVNAAFRAADSKNRQGTDQESARD